MLHLEKDGDVYVATDVGIPGLLVVSKDVLTLINDFVPKAISDLVLAKRIQERSEEIARDYEQ